MSNQENDLQENKAPIAPILLGFATLTALIIIVVMFVMNQSAEVEEQPSDTQAIAIIDSSMQSNGVVELDTKTLSNFALTDTSGNEVMLADLSGKYVMVYFGFTHCPDFCPTTLTDYKLIKRELGELADKITFVMISVDPKRDTPEMLEQYLAPYDESFVGLTAVVPEDGSAHDTANEVLRPIADDFGVFFQINDTGQVENYGVDHTSSKFLINPEGELTTQYSYGTLVDVIVDDLRQKITQ